LPRCLQAQEKYLEAHSALLPVALRIVEVYTLWERLPDLHASYSFCHDAALAVIRSSAADALSRAIARENDELAVEGAVLVEEVDGNDDDDGNARARGRPHADSTGDDAALSDASVAALTDAVTWDMFWRLATTVTSRHRFSIAVALTYRVLRASGKLTVSVCVAVGRCVTDAGVMTRVTGTRPL
jgi:hypothetical protein